jgi:hypothetical protein
MTAAELIYLADWRETQDRLVREENELLKRLLASVEAQRGKQ